MTDHIRHLRIVLEVLAKNQLYAKMSKCMFACLEVEYLGHIISGEGVKTDPKKILAMQEWPVPKDFQVLERVFRPHRLLQEVCEELWSHCSPINYTFKEKFLFLGF